MAKKIHTVIATGIAVMLTLAAVEPPGASAIEHGQQGHHHRAARQRQRTARRKTIRRRAINYVCPMHPDMRSNSPGTCPKCLMELVRKDAKPT